MLLRRQAVVQSVTQLVRHHQCVAKLAREVEHHVRVMPWRDRHAVRAAGLTHNHRRVDPAVLEEVVDQVAGAFRETSIGAEH